MATDGVPRALTMPAERARAATLPKPTLLGEGDGGDIERVGEGVGGGDHAGVLAAFEVAGDVAVAEVLGVVIEAGDGGEGAGAEIGAVERGVEGGGVDEGLEDGAGGALGEGVVELGGAVVAAADKGEDLAGVGVEGDERDLGIGVSVVLADELVYVAHAGFNGFRGDALELGVERGVDAEGLVVQVVAETLDELFMDEVDEVGGFGGVDVGWGEIERGGFGSFGLIGGDGAGLGHGVEDDVAALHGAFRVAVGVAAVGVLDEAGDEGALGERELVEGLAEVGLGGLADAVDGEGAALADVDLVGVHLEDLLLVEARFELEGDHDLAKLARVTLLRREEEAAGELHGEG